MIHLSTTFVSPPTPTHSPSDHKGDQEIRMNLPLCSLMYSSFLGSVQTRDKLKIQLPQFHNDTRLADRVTNNSFAIRRLMNSQKMKNKRYLVTNIRREVVPNRALLLLLLYAYHASLLFGKRVK